MTAVFDQFAINATNNHEIKDKPAYKTITVLSNLSDRLAVIKAEIDDQVTPDSTSVQTLITDIDTIAQTIIDKEKLN